jgi:hypothetical protein
MISYVYVLQILWPKIELVSNDKDRCMLCRQDGAARIWRPGRIITIYLKLIFKRNKDFPAFQSICLNKLKFVDSKRSFFI